MSKIRKLLFVFNPEAGKGQIKNKLFPVLNIFSKQGCEVTVYPTQEHGDAMRMVEKKAGRFDLVVCSGGDGTLDEVVSGMMHREKRVDIGYIPSGTANDFATSLKLPKDMLKAAEIAVGGEAFACDIGRLNHMQFVYIAAFGLFTEISYGTPQEWKNLLGHAAYFLNGAMSLQSYKSYEMRVECNEEVMEGEFIYGMVTNSTSVGGFPNMAGRNVLLNDGLFEITLIKAPKNPVELSEILGCLTKLIDDSPLIYSAKADRIRFEAKENVAWTIDGEFGGEHKEVEIENQKQAISIMVRKTMRRISVNEGD
jgi:YegS/Rv2252/BmrU family lipid kinase